MCDINRALLGEGEYEAAPQLPFLIKFLLFENRKTDLKLCNRELLSCEIDIHQELGREGILKIFRSL